jgi:hypothetical protein
MIYSFSIATTQADAVIQYQAAQDLIGAAVTNDSDFACVAGAFSNQQCDRISLKKIKHNNKSSELSFMGN